jgi:asparagine synthase (glutamine-hydrolysing)
MCGIAGICRLCGEPPSVRSLAPALSAMAHRGPDAEGVLALDRTVLGTRRLAIIDRKGGTQPMTSAGGGALCFNGEIHDFPEHRARLRAEGVSFSTRSDTEVLLSLLDREGPAALDKVHGIYAFAHVDGPSGRLTLGRDHCGAKPLVYTVDEERGELSFASELPGLLALEDKTPQIDLLALAERAAFQIPLSSHTLLKGVRTLPPGHTLTVDRDGKRRLSARPAPSFVPEEGRNAADWADELRSELQCAVREALRADVPLGLTLSGGIDSTLVAAMATREAGPGLPAFTGYFEEGPAYDEREYARVAAKEIGLDLHEVAITPDDLPTHIRRLAVALEGPIAGPGSLPQFVTDARAAKEVTVVLTGHGADETFGGYARHRLAWLDERGELDPDRLPEGLSAYRPLALHLQAGGRAGNFEERFFRMVYRGGEVRSLAGPVLAEALDAFDPKAAFADAFKTEDGDPFHRMVSFERRHLLPALLHVEDRVGMANSIESRVPLLSPRILALAARIPPEIAFGGELKRIFKQAARGVAPDRLVDRRDKMGFPVPLGRWAAGPLETALRELLNAGPLVDLGILAPGAPERLLTGAGGHGRHLWFFLCLSEWMAATGARP